MRVPCNNQQNYLGNSSLCHAKSMVAIFACQVLMMGIVETYHANQAPPVLHALDRLRMQVMSLLVKKVDLNIATSSPNSHPAVAGTACEKHK